MRKKSAHPTYCCTIIEVTQINHDVSIFYFFSASFRFPLWYENSTSSRLESSGAVFASVRSFLFPKPLHSVVTTPLLRLSNPESRHNSALLGFDSHCGAAGRNISSGLLFLASNNVTAGGREERQQSRRQPL